ncbi:MAG: gamma-glutamyl-gamma-aminobutyrate hydrolase family protein [Clostridia bacterium]|nr:gamma-glutamyl-gamma-aminobutyrate hydrolase family protein [Clostridia bacterium]
MKRPRIGIPPYFNYQIGEEYMPEGYLRAADCLNADLVTLHYDIPLGHMPALVKTLDGLILSGGVDVDPRRYGQEPTPQCGRINPDRDNMEFALIQEALSCQLPILAICRGMQILNVVLGGTLHQDIPTDFPSAAHEQQNGRHSLSHEVNLVPGGRLAEIYEGQEKLLTNSFHHQAVDRLAEGLIPEAYAQEGFIEAYRGPGSQWILGVQWHPEVSFKVDPPSRRIFTRFSRELQS